LREPLLLPRSVATEIATGKEKMSVSTRPTGLHHILGGKEVEEEPCLSASTLRSAAGGCDAPGF
jgi:hypothetical protein